MMRGRRGWLFSEMRYDAELIVVGEFRVRGEKTTIDKCYTVTIAT